jgi:hypothetical protein
MDAATLLEQLEPGGGSESTTYSRVSVEVWVDRADRIQRVELGFVGRPPDAAELVKVGLTMRYFDFGHPARIPGPV